MNDEIRARLTIQASISEVKEGMRCVSNIGILDLSDFRHALIGSAERVGS